MSSTQRISLCPRDRFVSIVVLVLCAGCLAAQDAAARPQSAAVSDQTAGGTIFGRVLDDSTLTPPPAADVAVDAYDTTGTVVSSAWTGSDGSYTLSGLPAGTYKVGFAPVARSPSSFRSSTTTRCRWPRPTR